MKDKIQDTGLIYIKPHHTVSCKQNPQISISKIRQYTMVNYGLTVRDDN